MFRLTKHEVHTIEVNKIALTLFYMGYFDNLFYMGGAKKPPSLSLEFDF